MPDTPVLVLSVDEHVLAFATTWLGSFTNLKYNKAMEDIIGAVQDDNWKKVLILLEMFASEDGGSVPDEASWLIDPVKLEKADFLVD